MKVHNYLTPNEKFAQLTVAIASLTQDSAIVTKCKYEIKIASNPVIIAQRREEKRREEKRREEKRNFLRNYSFQNVFIKM